ncbi:hypothetical protein NO995_08260 [Aestuariibaculum sp. M13]|uniref:hypothetical protein n=1 Tax=Aestuariibaculum sp. M13 TaxID=2967132 RepID=UPI002159F5E4|nr:hypothetical protein [Aestuariibaculum sp. M13]MCR8667672.1 hypothetical protein [Aestuariibaculum sp. M13]
MLLKAKAAAEAVNTKKSKALLIPVEKVIENAKVNINMPLKNAFIIVIFKFLK